MNNAADGLNALAHSLFWQSGEHWAVRFTRPPVRFASPVLCVGRGVLQFKSYCSVVRTPSVTGGGLACKSSETHLNEGCACLALAPFLRHFGSSCLWVGSDCHLRLRTGADVLFFLLQTQTSQLRNRCYFITLPPGFITLLYAVLGGMPAARTFLGEFARPGNALLLVVCIRTDFLDCFLFYAAVLPITVAAYDANALWNMLQFIGLVYVHREFLAVEGFGL